MSYCQRLASIAISLLVLVAPVSRVAAQGVQVGTVSGIVRSADQLSLPGVTVTATSPNLQGERVGVSDSNGVYYLQGLPSGSYTVSFELSGFQSATRETIDVRVGAVATVDAVMSVAADANGIPTGYIKGPRFGQATSGAHFPQPYPGQNGGRTVRMAFGVRFSIRRFSLSRATETRRFYCLRVFCFLDCQDSSSTHGLRHPKAVTGRYPCITNGG